MRVVLLLVVCVFAVASARTITWTGAAGNSLWSFANNWDANAVPTASDDVIINPVGGGSIIVSAPAAAQSLALGGGNYRITLTLQSAFTVGNLNIKQSGTLTISTNNDLPLTTSGTVRAQQGGVIVFQSGAIIGKYIVDAGGAILFSTNALKLLSNASLTIVGEATVQPTTIQLTKNSLLNNTGNFTVIGQVSIFATPNDKGNLLYNKGNFTYQGASSAAPLTIQVNTSMNSDFNIVSGSVLFEDALYIAGTVKLPQGTAITVQAGTAYVWIRNIQGSGSIIIDSPTVIGNFAVSWVTLADSGSLTISASSSTKSLSVGGKLILNSGVTFTATDVSVVAGTITGAGRLMTSGNFEIAPTTTGNTNSFISAEVVVSGRGYTTGVNQLLFSDSGNLHIVSGGTFTISATVTILKQSGSPVITNEGTFTVNLPVGGVFTSSVDYRGASGNLLFTGGLVIFQGDVVTAGKVSITTTLVEFRTAEAHIGPVTGSGSINITAAPPATSTFGDLSIAYLGVRNGNVSTGVVTVNTLEIFSGILNVGTSNSHTATIFNYYGGTLNGNGQISSSTLNLALSSPSNLRTIKLVTKQFKLQPTVASTALLIDNFASIVTSS